MGSTTAFETADRQAAHNFAEAARQAGVQRLIYLGGLGDSQGNSLTASAQPAGSGGYSAATGVPVIELRSSIVIGSGSLSFEIIRALVERLPVMITPRWVSIPTQPIAIEDVIAYLVAAFELPGHDSRVFEIGGADQVCYGDIMREYARQRGLRRLMVSVPVLTPRLSSLWLGLVTPIYARIGRQLIDGIRNPTVVQDAQPARCSLSVLWGSVRPLPGRCVTKIKNLPRPAGRTRFLPSSRPRPGVACGLEPGWWIPG